MASATVQGGQKFPEGTSVAAYPASNWSPTRQPPSGAPEGSSAATATVTNGVALFTGLVAKTRYYAYALVSSEHRYVQFTTSDLTVFGEATRNNNDDGQAGIRFPTNNRSQIATGALTASRRYAQRGYVDRPFRAAGISFVVTTFSATDDPVDVGLYDGSSAAVNWITSSGATLGKVNASNGRKVILFPTPVLLQIGVYFAAFAYGASAAPASLAQVAYSAYPIAQAFGSALPQLEIDAVAGATLPTTVWGTIGALSSAGPELILLEA